MSRLLRPVAVGLLPIAFQAILPALLDTLGWVAFRRGNITTAMAVFPNGNE